MKNLSIIIFLLLTISCCDAQTVVLNVDRTNETFELERGPNLKRFTHFFIRGGMFASSDKPGARIIYGSSVNLGFGVRKKYKIGSVYSIGFELENQFEDFKLKQEAGKVLPDTIINNVSQRIDYSSLGFGFFNRFNFDPSRGNQLGKFLDIGAMFVWHYSIKEIAKNDQGDGTLVKEITKNLNYTNTIGATAYARLGISHFSIFASYRLTKLFRKSYDYPEVPALAIGFDLAVF